MKLKAIKVSAFLMIFITIIAYSCKDISKENELPRNVKEKSEVLLSDTIRFEKDFELAKEFFVYNDSVLIVLNRKYENTNFIEIYELKNLKLIGSFFRLGSGPDEMLSALAVLNENLLIVSDYVKNAIGVVNIDSVLNNPTYRVTPYRHYLESPSIVPFFEGNKLVAENSKSFKDEDLGVDTKLPRLLLIDKHARFIDTQKTEYYTRNVTCDGDIITNKKTKRIVYSYMCKPLLEFYDENLNLIKSIKGPDKLPAKYRIENKEIIFDGVVPYTYLNFCSNNNNFWVTYIGDYLTNGKRMEDFPIWIFEFDWNGNFIKSYNAKQYISSISISKSSDLFYATGYDSDKSPILLKLSKNKN